MALFESYGWPGNVRELRNVIERVALLARDRTIRAADLAAALGAGRVAAGPPETDDGPGGLPTLDLDELEGLAIERALASTGWHQGEAADVLGISPRTLHRKIRALGLERPTR